MKKIVFIIGDMYRGGAQRVISILANDYAANGWDVSIALLLGNNIGYKLNNRIRILDYSRNTNSYASNALYWIKSLRNAMKSIKPDAVVSFVGRINILSLIAGAGLKINILVSERNDPEYDNRKKFEMLVCKLMYSRAKKVIFQTEYQKRWYGKYCEKNGVIIGNPIAINKYEGPHIRNNVIAVGKLMPQKNHEMLIRAFAKIISEFPEKKVYIYGDGMLRETLAKLCKELCVEDKVHLCGNVENIDDIMKEEKYFIMSSNYEGMSNALLEAMMLGMICITTNWNGAEDIIEDGISGFVVKKQNIDDLVTKMRYVFNEKEEILQSIRIKAISEAQQYSTDFIMSKWRKNIEN
jgi:GalNAc-alpha-(1->4)-GalNAc-alpha-(1->3)-diNAcBac-PP-undecaprenol alpha-1,4-N-acetyl-D-galactosaminyltransferase